MSSTSSATGGGCGSVPGGRAIARVTPPRSRASPRSRAIARYAVTAPGVAEIAFALGEEIQGQGFSRTLVEALLEEGRSAGLERLTATTLADNAAALGLLRGTGFRVVGRDGATVELARAAAP